MKPSAWRVGRTQRPPWWPVTGAAWAITDHCTATKNKKDLEEFILKIRPGIGAEDQALREGIAGSIQNARRQGLDADFPLKVVNDLIAGTQDPLKQAAPMGIILKLQQRR